MFGGRNIGRDDGGHGSERKKQDGKKGVFGSTGKIPVFTYERVELKQHSFVGGDAGSAAGNEVYDQVFLGRFVEIDAGNVAEKDGGFGTGDNTDVVQGEEGKLAGASRAGKISRDGVGGVSGCKKTGKGKKSKCCVLPGQK